MADGARDVAASVALLKQQLAQVDEQVRQVTELLHQSTGAVRVALGETEQGLAKLDRQLKRFPEREPAVPPPRCPGAAPQTPRPGPPCRRKGGEQEPAGGLAGAAGTGAWPLKAPRNSKSMRRMCASESTDTEKTHRAGACLRIEAVLCFPFARMGQNGKLRPEQTPKMARRKCPAVMG